MCICTLMLAWISSKIATKLLGMPTYFDRSSLTGLDPLSCRLISLLSDVDWPLASPFANSPPEFLCPTPFAFPYPLPVTSRSRAQAFVWFRAKTDKGIVCLVDHLHSVTQTQQFRVFFYGRSIVFVEDTGI